MKTFFVQINVKFMVKLTVADDDMNLLGAEHYFLDNIDGVWGAMAYDEKTMKTDTFIGAMMGAELVSEAELAKRFAEYADTLKTGASCMWQVKELENEVERKREELEQAEKDLHAAERNLAIVLDEINTRKTDLGIR